MFKELTKRKIILILSVFIILITSILFFIKRDNSFLYKSKNNNDKYIVKQLLIQKISEDDNDNDGLKNWEEVLWKTDPNNPDTDGDGTSDNDEVKQNRDPLKKGPNDLIEKRLDNNSKIKNQVITTKTGETANDLLMGYLTLKQSGLLNQQNEQNLVAAIIEKNTKNDVVEKYTILDLKTTNKNDEITLKKYSDEVINILNKNNNKNDLFILKEAIDKKDDEILKQLNESATNYRTIQTNLLEIVVPKILINNHLIIINTISDIARNTENMSNSFKDPIKAMLSVNNYVENEKIIINEFQKIGEYLKERGIKINI